MRVGCPLFATVQGLGLLAKAFYDNGVITDPLIVAHGKRQEFTEWYPQDTPRWASLSATEELYDYVRKLDVVLLLETPFNWNLIPYCRSLGVKTVLVPMYECMPSTLPQQPDKIVSPSKLDREYYPASVLLTVPAPSGEEVPWRLRTHARTFVHNAGNGGLRGRNGTRELLEAWAGHVQSPAQLIVRSQEPIDPKLTACHRENADGGRKSIDVRVGTFPREQLYSEGDVFVFPEAFNGISLPLQEAYSAGMMVMAGARYPMTDWLPEKPLIPVRDYVRERIAGHLNEYARAVYDPVQIASTIDRWYDKDISEFSLLGRAWREENSWDVLKPEWLKALS